MRCAAQACERPRAYGRGRDGRFSVLKGLEAENQTGSCYYFGYFCSLSKRRRGRVGIPESCSQPVDAEWKQGGSSDSSSDTRCSSQLGIIPQSSEDRSDAALRV